MLQGTIVENSLSDPGILNSLEVTKSWSSGDWKLHQVHVSREQAINLGEHISEGPWYIHFWESDRDNVLVVFKDKTFDIKYSDPSTWKEAIIYGQSIGIPKEQLTFVIG